MLVHAATGVEAGNRAEAEKASERMARDSGTCWLGSYVKGQGSDGVGEVRWFFWVHMLLGRLVTSGPAEESGHPLGCVHPVVAWWSQGGERVNRPHRRRTSVSLGGGGAVT
jgi:hypothetical protein